jgi:hypothetical protein
VGRLTALPVFAVAAGANTPDTWLGWNAREWVS